MIVWSGFGFLTALYAVAGLLIGNYFDSIPYHTTLGIVLASGANWFTGRSLNGRPGRTLIDQKTGEELEYKVRHTFFWVNMEWWSVVLVVLAIFIAYE